MHQSTLRASITNSYYPPPPLADPLARGDTAYAGGNYSEAYEIWTACVPLHEDHPSNLAVVHTRRAAALIALERFQEAVGVCDEVLKLTPDVPDALLSRAIALGGLDDWPVALTAAEIAAKAAPESADAASRCALALLRVGGRAKESAREFERSLALGAGEDVRRLYADALKAEAAACDAAGDLQGARVALDKAIILGPSAHRHYNRGFVFLRLEDSDASISDFKSAIGLDASFGPAYHALGTALLKKEDYTGAAEALSQAGKLLPAVADVAYNCGYALLKLTKPAEARPHFERALTIDPTMATAKKALAFCTASLIPITQSTTATTTTVESPTLPPPPSTNLPVKVDTSSSSVARARAAPPSNFTFARAAFSPPDLRSASGSASSKVTLHSMTRATSPSTFFIDSVHDTNPSAMDGFEGLTLALAEMKVFPYSTAENFNSTIRECYLSTADFDKAFGMTKQVFFKLPKWKRTAKKKELGLF
jgi:tetratricopeptide (TPR) repeat protein